jgi:hypothetical protein
VAKRSHGIRLPQPLSKSSMEDVIRRMEDYRKTEEKREKKEKRDRRRDFIRSGVKEGFTVRQVLWIMKHFSPTNHKHWDGRVGGG